MRIPKHPTLIRRLRDVRVRELVARCPPLAASLPGNRRHVNDFAVTSFDHQRGHRSRTDEASLEAQIDNKVPIVVGHVLKQGISDIAGIVDQDV